MQTDVSKVKCACADCVCMVDADHAVKRETRLFCSDACADGHKDGVGCEHAGCACAG